MQSESNAPTKQAPKYRSHKEVWALQLRDVAHKPDGSLDVFFREPGFGGRTFSASEMESRPQPRDGWYYVVYEDGYFSFSPPGAFEAGYTRITD